MTKSVQFFLLLYFLFLSLTPAKGQDSTSRKSRLREYFVEDISDKLNISLFTLSNKNNITLTGKKGINLDYEPNDYLAIGVSVRLYWLGLSFGYAPKNIQEKLKGSTTYTNFKLSSYGKKMGFDVYYLDYSGYYLGNSNTIPELNLKPKTNYIRPDLSTLNIGANYYYIFNNKRYSYRSTFIQNEIQKHSAGSFMLNGSLNYYSMQADSSMVPKSIDPERFSPEAKIKNGDFYNLSLMPGYGHTFVLKQRLFLTLSLFGGVDFQQQHYSSESREGNHVFDEFEIIPRAMGRVGAGYNSRRFFFGMNVIGDVYNIPLGKNERLTYSVGNASLFFGYHFNLPESFKKKISWMKKFPNINIQKN